MVISGVRDLPEGTVRLQQRVFSLHYITITDLVLGLVVTSVRVGYGVRVVVFGVGLRKNTFILGDVMKSTFRDYLKRSCGVVSTIGKIELVSQKPKAMCHYIVSNRIFRSLQVKIPI